MSSRSKMKRKVTILLNPFVRNYMPKWLIFLIDLGIIVFSVIAAFYLVDSISGKNFSIINLEWPVWAIIGIQILFLIGFRSYSGLIRYSRLQDAWKQLKVVGSCVITLLVINQLYYVLHQEKLILNAGAVIYGVTAFLLLLLFRIIVKGIYEAIQGEGISSNAYILGTGREDVSMASGLIAQKSDKFSIVGFINHTNRRIKNNIFGLPIYNIDQLKFKRKSAQIVIVSEERLKSLRDYSPSVFSELLDQNLKIYKLPKLQDWRDEYHSGFNALKEINIEDLLQRSPIKLNNEKLQKIYQNKVIMITGAAGSIGSEIVRQVSIYKPKKVLLIDQAETPLHDLSLELCKDFPNLAFEKLIANVRNRPRMEQIYQLYKPDAVFHAAAYKHVPMMESNPGESISVNFVGTRNIAELAVKYKAERFVFVSTDKAVNPTNIMGATKRAAEIFIQNLAQQNRKGTTFITTRFGNVLGSNGSVVPLFKNQIAEGGPITVTHPKITRYFMTIDEACQLVLEAGGMGKGGEIFVFDMGRPIKIVDLAKQMIQLSGLTPNKDIRIEFTGLRPGEKLYEELLADKETTITTHHKKIMIGQATYDSNREKLGLLDNLKQAIEAYDSPSALRILKKIVPEYHQEKIKDSDQKFEADLLSLKRKI